ncbi:hypothetical protein PAMC26510_30240 [Caballeronia sordidicola]|uniref:Uncharacterized protein n=1 Tax=Caballeronia sordidicola TaxID=196367 RepID=A0A242M987_CABSO|nr:hypothetical protein PAMC26510_30240 [Caballeronia sordidicola]
MSTQPNKKASTPLSLHDSKTDERTLRFTLPMIPVIAVAISGFAILGAIFLGCATFFL